MELIERYLFQVGRHLPPRQRADILSELRSSLEDSMEARAEGAPQEADAIAVLEELGHPRAVAASYYPEGQYLIGPTLYPYFRTIAGIAITAVVFAQLLVIILSLVTSPESISISDSFWDLLGAIPWTLGALVLLFALLQRYGVTELEGIREAWEQEAFDPTRLPPITDTEEINHGETIFELLVTTMLLVWLTRYYYNGGFSGTESVAFLTNPVLEQYFPWIAVAIILSLVIDGMLLWHGRWQRSTRIARILVDGFSLLIVALVLQGHSTWLAARGFGGVLPIIDRLPEALALGGQVAGMLFFQLCFAGALIVIAIELTVQLYRLTRSTTRLSISQNIGMAGIP